MRNKNIVLKVKVMIPCSQPSGSDDDESNSLDSLPKKRSRVSTRTEDFEYEMPTGTRRRRSGRNQDSNKSESRVKYDIVVDNESRYECPACPMKFDFDYGLLSPPGFTLFLHF